MSQPAAVIISDIHFSPTTLELASQSLISAQKEAVKLKVPLIIAGDLLDSKAIIRAECANRLLDIFDNPESPPTVILVGNHDRINEKSQEHSLNFLKHKCIVVDAPQVAYLAGVECLMIPYQSDPARLEEILANPRNPSLLICHQGVQTAYMGHYIQDNSSLPKECFGNYRVISGHYHKAQDIKCGRPRKGAVGLFSYVGNPYTLSFSESNDGPKGFRILYSNGLLETIPLNLRKHIVEDRGLDTIYAPIKNYRPHDIVWIKVSGPKSELDKLSKKEIGERIIGTQNFKFDKIYSDSPKLPEKVERLSEEQILDDLIDQSDETPQCKEYLKTLWRDIICQKYGRA